jgi:3-oxoacyl-[acyl-carrier protein] reductase
MGKELPPGGPPALILVKWVRGWAALTGGRGGWFAERQQGDKRMDLGLRDRVALVSGGSKGIGKAIAAGFAREGAKVALCARTEEEVKTTAAMIAEETGVETLGVQADLTRTEDAERFVAASVERFGRIDILVNNAGSARGGVIEHLTDEDWEQALQLKFLGYVRLIRAVLPTMRRQGGGRVVNLIGNDGVKHSYWEIAPGAANAAGQNLTLSLAGQFGRENISFVAVNPGPVRTERWDGLVRAMARDMKLSVEEADRLAPRSIPLGRIAEVEEVADLVVFLASERARFVNGTMIEIDGGQQKPLMDALRDG